MNKTGLIVLAAVLIAGGLYAIRYLDRGKSAESDSILAPSQSRAPDEANSQKQEVMLQENQIKIKDNIITVDIADSPEERMQGLSGRERLQLDSGMLFVFDQPTDPNFWMKDMNFPIDILWVDVNGVIVGFEENIEPSTYPQTFSPPVQVQYVLEVPSGWVLQKNIQEGTLVEGSMIK